MSLMNSFNSRKTSSSAGTRLTGGIAVGVNLVIIDPIIRPRLAYQEADGRDLPA